jgi:hypothetical protein
MVERKGIKVTCNLLVYKKRAEELLVLSDPTSNSPLR